MFESMPASRNTKPSSRRFNEAYYRRYYFDPRTAVTTRAQVLALARLIAAQAGFLELPVHRILDAGCGCGLLRAPLKRLLPKARYVGLEVSEYLCRRYGWIHGGIDAFRTPTPFSLVICQDVLQYLDDRAAARALANLARACDGLLYFSVVTDVDWRRNCDRRFTDPPAHTRTAAWYRSRMDRHFQEIGCGFWLRRGEGSVLWEMEKAPRPRKAER